MKEGPISEPPTKQNGYEAHSNPGGIEAIITPAPPEIKEENQMDTIMMKGKELPIEGYVKAKGMEKMVPIIHIPMMTDKKRDDRPQSQWSDEDMLEIKRKITGIMREIGVPSSISGYRYIREAVQIMVKNPDLSTMAVYAIVASQYFTKPLRVERNIRVAIEKAWLNGDPDTLTRYFGYTVSCDKGKPTNKEFITMIADIILLERGVVA